MVAFSPDGSHLSGLRHRDNVLICFSTDDASEPVVLFKTKPLSTTPFAPVKLSLAATLDAIGVLVRNQRIRGLPGGLPVSSKGCPRPYEVRGGMGRTPLWKPVQP